MKNPRLEVITKLIKELEYQVALWHRESDEPIHLEYKWSFDNSLGRFIFGPDDWYRHGIDIRTGELIIKEQI